MAFFASPLRGEVGAQRRVGSRTNQMLWAGLLTASAACYLLKLAGLSLPARLLQDARVQRTIPLVPIALLAALGVAAIAVLLRAPFLVVVASAAATAALLRVL